MMSFVVAVVFVVVVVVQSLHYMNRGVWDKVGKGLS